MEQKWISVTQQLPEPIDSLPRFSRRVLISTCMGCFTAQYDYEERVWVDEALRAWIKKPLFLPGVGWSCPATRFDESMNVTHWMDLPEQPVTE